MEKKNSLCFELGTERIIQKLEKNYERAMADVATKRKVSEEDIGWCLSDFSVCELMYHIRSVLWALNTKLSSFSPLSMYSPPNESKFC